MRPLRILALMHDVLVPPVDTSGFDLAEVPWKMEYDVTANLRDLGHDVTDLGIGADIDRVALGIYEHQPDIVFNLLEDLHDVATFDHNIVGYLELKRLRYTGCNARGLILARDKMVARAVLAAAGVAVPWAVVVERGRLPARRLDAPYPLIVKSRTKDASHGISQASVVGSSQELAERIRFVHEFTGSDALVEEYIEGREFYVGALGNRTPKLLPIWELHLDRMKARWRIASSRVKWNGAYQRRNGIRTGPARRLPPALAEHIRRTARVAWRALGLSGYARLDFRLRADGRLYCIEANPNPQLAYGEDFAESAERGGLGYLDLLQAIVAAGLRWRADRLG